MKKFHTLKVKDIERETPEAVSVLFDVPDDLKDDYRYRQGQHITIKRKINGEELRRCYSICAGVDEEELRIAVKEIDEGRFSGFINRELEKGDKLEVFPPAGHFNTDLDPGNEKTYVAFAGGSGITPVLSLIKTTLAREAKSRFKLFYGNRNTDSIIFRDKLAALKDRYMGRLELFHILEEDETDIQLFRGLMDREKTGQLVKWLCPADDIDEAFICGPGPMMDAVEATLRDAGVDEDKIHIERFVSGPDVKPQKGRRKSRPREKGDARARVTVVIDGERKSFNFRENDESILDAALEAGANAPFACKGAVCATCRARVLEGDVEMEKNYALEDDELEQGYVLTCQARPVTDKVVVSFDE